ncbi:MAG TPA: head-tail joining protein [Candidatus Wunengus sp. YC60]|uniref:head-tail joining protein n=1 Tax=Candidatus Wunengus sp. YC60 TaxID=3367697 RepID=UPI0040270A1D
MGLRTQLKTDLVNMFATMGETATFTPTTGAGVTCYVLLSIAVDMQPDLDTQSWMTGKTIECLFADIGRTPERGETFVVDSVTYTVASVIENDGMTVKMAVK